MVDVFISYSRRDREVVRWLHEALAARGRDSWVDWEDIPPTAEWLAEIFAAIEGTNAFLFVLSPDSAASNVCLEELAHAVKNNKRLIPVLCRDVAPQDVPKSLAKLNWIFLRETDDFDAGVEELLDAVDTDLDWVKAHTRLLIKALEWDGKGRDPSPLLRRNDLREAEAWLAQSGDKEPKPTELQGEFILASRKAESSRIRRTLSAAIIALLGMTVLAVVAYIQYRLSEERGRIALSRQLAAQALHLMETRLDLSLLLSVAATKVVDTPEAKSSLLTGVLYQPELVSFLQGHHGSVRNVAFSPDGRFLAAAGEDNTIRLWEVANRQPHGSPLKGHTREIEVLVFTPDSKILASAGKDKTVRLWEVEHTQPLGSPLIGHKSSVACAAFSPDGQILASAGRDDVILLWEMKTHQLFGWLRLPPGHIQYYIGTLAFNPNGKILVSSLWSSPKMSILFWDLERQQLLGPPIEVQSAQRLAFCPNGKTLALGAVNGLSLWDVATRRKVITLGQEITPKLWEGKLDQTLLNFGYLGFSPDGKTLAAAGNGIVSYYDIPRGQLYRTLRIPSHRMAFHPNPFTLASTGDSLIVWEVNRKQAISQIIHDFKSQDYKGFSDRIGKVGFSRDGSIMVLSRGWNPFESKVEFWDTTRRQFLTPPWPSPGYFVDMYSKEFDVLAVRNEAGTITLWDVQKRESIGDPREIPFGGKVTYVCFSPDKRLLAYGLDDKTIRLWDMSRCQFLGQPLKGHENEVFCLAFSPDGKTLASVSRGQLYLWDVIRQEPRGPVLSLQGQHENSVEQLTFSPDGKILATGSDDRIVFWDAAKCSILGPLLAKSSFSPGVMAFSPDGNMLAVANKDLVDKGPIALWDVARRHPLPATIKGHQNEIRALAFSPDGNTLMSIDPLGWMLFHDMRVTSWQALACQRANRNLTREEWEQYLPGEPYRKICPDLPGPED